MRNFGRGGRRRFCFGFRNGWRRGFRGRFFRWNYLPRFQIKRLKRVLLAGKSRRDARGIGRLWRGHGGEAFEVRIGFLRFGNGQKTILRARLERDGRFRPKSRLPGARFRQIVAHPVAAARAADRAFFRFDLAVEKREPRPAIRTDEREIHSFLFSYKKADLRRLFVLDFMRG